MVADNGHGPNGSDPRRELDSGAPDPLMAGKTVALIPAYNEERYIGSVVIKTRRFVDDVIVVDDGSSDLISPPLSPTTPPWNVSTFNSRNFSFEFEMQIMLESHDLLLQGVPGFKEIRCLKYPSVLTILA